MTEIKLKKGEPVEKALRRLKKKIDREGTLKEVRNHRRFEKPSEKRQDMIYQFNIPLLHQAMGGLGTRTEMGYDL